MNQEEMNVTAKQLKSELENFNYDNFANKHAKTGYCTSWTSKFREFIEKKLKPLVNEASNKFKNQRIDEPFRQGIKILDVKKKPVNSDDFEKGKEILLICIRYIEENTTPQTRLPNIGMPKNPNKNKPHKICVSYYSEQFFTQIQTIFSALDALDAEMVNLEYIPLKQFNSLQAVSMRIEDINSCFSAIICLPLDQSSEKFNPIAYMDLGACMALFPERTLLIYEAGDLPDSLASKVETFKFLGNLNFQTGLELSRKILNILQTGAWPDHREEMTDKVYSAELTSLSQDALLPLIQEKDNTIDILIKQVAIALQRPSFYTHTNVKEVGTMTNNPGGISVGGNVGGDFNNVQGDNNLQGDNNTQIIQGQGAGSNEEQ
ncbi:MAG: hypothetical protein F6K26_21370, partial [Moorea sp. SIO2I5]|nr:hypothetical protein [Moorena sp. SIO2I5]